MLDDYPRNFRTFHRAVGNKRAGKEANEFEYFCTMGKIKTLVLPIFVLICEETGKYERVGETRAKDVMEENKGSIDLSAENTFIIAYFHPSFWSPSNLPTLRFYGLPA